MGKFSLMDTILGCFKSKPKKSEPDGALEAAGKDVAESSHTVAFQSSKDEAIIVIYNERFSLTPVKKSHPFVDDLQELDNAISNSNAVGKGYAQPSSESFEQKEVEETNAEAIDEVSVQTPINLLSQELNNDSTNYVDIKPTMTASTHDSRNEISNLARNTSEISDGKEKVSPVARNDIFNWSWGPVYDCQTKNIVEKTDDKLVKDKPHHNCLGKEDTVHNNEVDNYYHGPCKGSSSVAYPVTEIKSYKRNDGKAAKVKISKNFKMAETTKSLAEEEEVYYPEVDDCLYCKSSEAFAFVAIPKTEIESIEKKKVKKPKKLLKFPKFKKAKKFESLIEEEKISSSEIPNDSEPYIGYDKPFNPLYELGIAVKKEKEVKKAKKEGSRSIFKKSENYKPFELDGLENKHQDDTGENYVENVVGDTISALPKKKKSFKKKVVKIVTLSKVRKAIREKTSNTYLGA